MSASEKVFLWTRQDERMLNDLEKQGVFYVKKSYIEAKNEQLSSYYLPLYDWFVKAASKRIPHPVEHSGYPIWCSISEEYMLRGIAGNILLQLAIDPKRIIYFDSPKWDMVLNHMYIPKDENDAKAFDELLKNRGVKNSFCLLDDSHARFYPDLRRKLIDSWERIFEINEWNIFFVQANIWEIRPEDILSIERFSENPSYSKN